MSDQQTVDIPLTPSGDGLRPSINQLAAQYRAPGAAASRLDHGRRQGIAVLACRCGAMLDFADMHRPRRHPIRMHSGIRIDPICCRWCAQRTPIA